MVSARYCMGGGVRDCDFGLVMDCTVVATLVIHAYLNTPRSPPPESSSFPLHHPSTSTKSQTQNINHKHYLPTTHVNNPPIHQNATLHL